MHNSISFIRISQESRSNWDSLSSSSPVSTWFQTSEAYDFYVSLPELFEPFAFGVEEGGTLKGVIVGYVTREANSLKQLLTRRAIIIGGPLLSNDISGDAILLLLRETARSLRKKAIYIETRNLNDYSGWKPYFMQVGWQYEPHLNFQVDTVSLHDPFEIIGKHRRRYIRMSLKAGDEILEAPSIEQVREYYAILLDLYKIKVHTPLFPYSFFEKLFKLESSRFLLVQKEGRVIGGAVCVAMAGKGLYEWFACGMDTLEKGNYPSSVATYAGIKYAADNGLPRFDFMGAGKPDEPYGVRDFKAEFGGTLVEHGRFKYICSPLLYKLGCIGVKILKKI